MRGRPLQPCARLPDLGSDARHVGLRGAERLAPGHRLALDFRHLSCTRALRSR